MPLAHAKLQTWDFERVRETTIQEGVQDAGPTREQGATKTQGGVLTVWLGAQHGARLEAKQVQRLHRQMRLEFTQSAPRRAADPLLKALRVGKVASRTTTVRPGAAEEDPQSQGGCSTR